MTDNKYKHLVMIENVIERMSRNSFTLKGWALTLVVLLGSFASYEANQKYIIIVFLPVICFWFLDSVYLQKERKYRVLYNKVQQKKEEEIDFSMDIDKINGERKDARKLCYYRCLFSCTELTFYGTITLGIIILIIILTL